MKVKKSDVLSQDHLVMIAMMEDSELVAMIAGFEKANGRAFGEVAAKNIVARLRDTDGAKMKEGKLDGVGPATAALINAIDAAAFIAKKEQAIREAEDDAQLARMIEEEEAAKVKAEFFAAAVSKLEDALNEKIKTIEARDHESYEKASEFVLEVSGEIGKDLNIDDVLAELLGQLEKVCELEAEWNDENRQNTLAHARLLARTIRKALQERDVVTAEKGLDDLKYVAEMAHLVGVGDEYSKIYAPLVPKVRQARENYNEYRRAAAKRDEKSQKRNEMRRRWRKELENGQHQDVLEFVRMTNQRTSVVRSPVRMNRWTPWKTVWISWTVSATTAIPTTASWRSGSRERSGRCWACRMRS